MRSSSYLRTIAVSILVTFAAAHSSWVTAQTWQQAIGYDQLVLEQGGSVPNGSTRVLSMVEANTGAGSGGFTYLPNSANAQFTGKTIIDGSGVSTGPSSHATTVGQNFFGNTSSISQGSTNITGYLADHWVGDVLGFSTGLDPQSQPFHVQNHSYIGSPTPANATNMSRRFDYVNQQNNILSFAGTSNSSSTTLPRIFSQTYSGLIVGRSDGLHGAGFTTLYGNGRIKPDIVLPAPNISQATARSSSVGSVLSHQASLHSNGDASRMEVLKAAIMAGATKDEFPTWANTTTRPLDLRFGAGEVNIYNSFHILAAKEQNGSLTIPGNAITFRGWDYGEALAAGNTMFYDFHALSEIGELSLVLTWNPIILDLDPGPMFDPSFDLPNMSLSLVNLTTGFSTFSNSPVDNVEHIYGRNLEAGHYRIAVTTDKDTTFGLAWRISAIPEPSSMIAFGFVLAVEAFRRRKFLVGRSSPDEK